MSNLNVPANAPDLLSFFSALANKDDVEAALKALIETKDASEKAVLALGKKEAALAAQESALAKREAAVQQREAAMTTAQTTFDAARAKYSETISELRAFLARLK